MGYERYPRNSGLSDYYGDYSVGRDPSDYGQDYGSGRDYSYSSAREYQAAGELGRRRGYGGDGPRDQRDRGYGPRTYGQGSYTRDAGFRGSYASDGHRFAETDDRESARGRDGRQGPRGYDYDDRDFFSRAGDEVRSWFGDDEAERRREMDARHDARRSAARDEDYHGWRRSQIAALDRDYDEYRAENRTKFEREFGSWRNERQTQRSALSKVTEHMEVVGSDGEHVGTVDKVRGDRILLTRNDADAGGRHHSIPSRWIESVDDTVKIRKTAEEAKAHWRDEERGAFFGDDRDRNGDTGNQNGPHILNRSFSGTY